MKPASNANCRQEVSAVVIQLIMNTKDSLIVIVSMGKNVHPVFSRHYVLYNEEFRKYGVFS